MLPHMGSLQLFKPQSLRRRALRGKPLVPAFVWLHCGVHFCEELPTKTPPKSGEMPPLDGAGSHFKFFPLPRDDPRLPSVHARVFRAESVGELAPIADRWVLELRRGADPPLRFCADTEAGAHAWKKEVLMRLAPLTQVWERCWGAVCDCNGILSALWHDGAGGQKPAAAAGRGRLSTAASLASRIRSAVSNDVLAGMASMSTALTSEQTHRLAVGAGPLAGTVLSSLCCAVRVLAAAHGVFAAASEVAAGLNDLHDPGAPAAAAAGHA